MTNEEDVEKKKGCVIFSLVSYVSINCIRFTGIISAQSTPTNNGVQSIYFVGEGQGDYNISTHSRPKAAAAKDLLVNRFKEFQHTGTRRWLLHTKHLHRTTNGRFNTQPPEGSCHPVITEKIKSLVFQHTAARRRLHTSKMARLPRWWFQHTAARRRLRFRSGLVNNSFGVSTHSRPKAAAPKRPTCTSIHRRFNTQPPEGGCFSFNNRKQSVI